MEPKNKPHAVQCADAWLKDAGKPTYSDLLVALQQVKAALRKHGAHLDTCECVDGGEADPGLEEYCDCGLNASLAIPTPAAANAVAVPQSRDKDWGATWDAVFKALDPYTIGSGTRGEFNAAVNDVVVAVMANMAPATSENI